MNIDKNLQVNLTFKIQNKIKTAFAQFAQHVSSQPSKTSDYQNEIKRRITTTLQQMPVQNTKKHQKTHELATAG